MFICIILNYAVKTKQSNTLQSKNLQRTLRPNQTRDNRVFARRRKMRLRNYAPPEATPTSCFTSPENPQKRRLG